MNLRLKVVLITTLLTLLGLGLGLGLTYWSLLRLRLADLDADNRAVAELVLGSALDGVDTLAVARVESYLVRGGGVSSAQLYRGGRIVWQGGVFEAPLPLDPQGLSLGSGARSVGVWRVFTSSEGGHIVQVGRPLVGLRAIFRPYAAVTLPLAVGLAALSGLLAYGAAGLALRPLHTLTEAARHFEEGAKPPHIPGRDEAATLAKSFASLLERLSSERTREQRFLAYAAHELRTPISALRASLEAARLRPTAPDRDFLARLHREALRLETFTQNLLALSRAEMGELRTEELDLADLAATAYDRFQPLALESGKELRLAADPVQVRADPRLLEQALNNLVANAVRHTATGEITLGSGTVSGEAYLEVKDQGPGFPSEPREGLGLRVVRSVTDAHGGRFEVGGASGTKACLYLPTADAKLTP
ncbi:HAMP domain-containing sensor histidine kinase [soil metagenome]